MCSKYMLTKKVLAMWQEGRVASLPRQKEKSASELAVEPSRAAVRRAASRKSSEDSVRVSKVAFRVICSVLPQAPDRTGPWLRLQPEAKRMVCNYQPPAPTFFAADFIAFHKSWKRAPVRCPQQALLLSESHHAGVGGTAIENMVHNQQRFDREVRWEKRRNAAGPPVDKAESVVRKLDDVLVSILEGSQLDSSGQGASGHKGGNQLLS